MSKIDLSGIFVSILLVGCSVHPDAFLGHGQENSGDFEPAAPASAQNSSAVATVENNQCIQVGSIGQNRNGECILNHQVELTARLSLDSASPCSMPSSQECGAQYHFFRKVKMQLPQQIHISRGNPGEGLTATLSYDGNHCIYALSNDRQNLEAASGDGESDRIGLASGGSLEKGMCYKISQSGKVESEFPLPREPIQGQEVALHLNYGAIASQDLVVNGHIQINQE